MTSPLRFYVDGEIVPADQANVSVLDAGFQSGDAIWEGLRVYHGHVFRLEQHLDRLEHSAQALRITLPGGRDAVRDALLRTLAANEMTDETHVRLMVTRGTRSTSGMDPRNAPAAGTLVVVPEYKPVDPDPAPQRLRTASVRRPQPQVLDPSIHHANQLNSILARLEVLDDPDVDAALMLDVHGFVAEADTANIFCVVDGRLATPAPTACLHGITRGVVLDLAATAGLEADERALTLFDLYRADEVFLTGTVCELVPVTMVDGRDIGTGKPGPVWRSLLDRYRSLVDAETAD
ncbi:MAG TPA: aminotransferase class IV [Nocardioidaceae bacterium]